MLAKIISKLLGAPVEIVAGYFEKKMELKQELKLAKLEGKIANERARSELISRKLQMDHEWEGMQIQNSGWKDEYVLLLLSIPLVMCFIPGTVAYVTAGFAALNTTPMWYQLLITSVFFAVYGIRYWRRKED